MPLREQSRIKATASKAKKPIPAAAPEPSAPPLRGFETKGLWSDEELVAHERRATSPPPSPPAATASEPAPTCSVPCLSRTCPRICELDHGHPPDRDHSHASRPNEAGHTWPASEPAVRPLSVQLPSERLFGIYMRLQADSAERAALIEVQGQVRAIEAELAATARDYQAARDAHDRRHDDYNAARAEVEQLRGKLAEERKDGRAERVMLLRALPLDTGTATDTSGEAASVDVAFAEAMRGRQYGESALSNAHGWFEAGWNARPQADAIKEAVSAANNRAADAFLAWDRRDESSPTGAMSAGEFEAWLRSGEDAPGAVTGDI